jgi:uncharacterized protein
LRPDRVAERVAAWAASRGDVLGAGLAGSRFVLVVEDVTAYTQRAGWVEELGAERIVRTRRWGPLTERRLLLAEGRELALGIVEPAWVSVVPLDPGTRRVVEDGFRILHDPHGLLETLVSAVAARA